MVAGRLTARRPRTHGLQTKTRGQSGHTRAGVGWVAGAVLHAGSGFWVQSRAPEASAEAPKARAHECQCIWRESSQTWRRQDVRVRVNESSHGGSAQAQRGDAPFARGAQAEGRGLEARCPEGPGSRRQPGEGPGAESPDRSTPPAPPPPPQASGPSTVRGTRLSLRPVREPRSWAARKPPRPRGEPPRVMSRADRGARGSGRRRDHSRKRSLDPAAASRVPLGLSGVGLVAARWAVRPERSSADSALLPSGSLRGPPQAPGGTLASWERRGRGPESEPVRAGSPGPPRAASGSWPGCQAAPPDLWVVRAP